MSDNLPVDQEIASIRAKHDKHDYSQALSEVQQDLRGHSQNSAEQTAFTNKLVSSGLIGDLALEWGRQKLAQNRRGIASRPEIQAAEKSADPVDRLMAQQLDNDWDRISSTARGARFLGVHKLEEELATASTVTDAKVLTEPFRSDSSLFDKLKNDGSGSGIIFTHNGEITAESLAAAAKPDSRGLTAEQRQVAQKLLDNFDGDALRTVESGNFFTGRGITQEALNTFLQNNPSPQVDVQPPANALAAQRDVAVQRTAATLPAEQSPPATAPLAADRVAASPAPAPESTTAAPTIPAIPTESGPTAALPPKDSPDGTALRTAPRSEEVQPSPPLSSQIKGGEGPYQSFRSAHPDWTHQQALDAAHQVKSQLGREEFRQGEQFRTNADGSVTARLQDRRQPGAYTETTGKDGHTVATKTGDANGNWTSTTFDAGNKPTGSTTHKVTPDGWTEVTRGADGKPAGGLIHKKYSDGAIDNVTLDPEGKITQQTHISADGTSLRKTMDANSSNFTMMRFDKDGHEIAASRFIKNPDGSSDSTAYNKDERAVANLHVNADGTSVERKLDPTNPQVFKETKSDKDGHPISGSNQDSAGNKGAWIKNTDNTTTYTVQSPDKSSMHKFDASGKLSQSIEIDNQTHITIDIERKDGKFVKTTHSPGKPDVVENVDEPASQPPPEH